MNALEKERSPHFRGQLLLRYVLGTGPADATDAYPPGLETLGRLFQRHDPKKMSHHGDNESRSEHEQFVAEWLAMSIGPLSPFGSSSAAAVYDRDPESGASTLISAIRDRCSKLSLADSVVPATICVVANGLQEVACGTAAEQMAGLPTTPAQPQGVSSCSPGDWFRSIPTTRFLITF